MIRLLEPNGEECDCPKDAKSVLHFPDLACLLTGPRSGSNATPAQDILLGCLGFLFFCFLSLQTSGSSGPSASRPEAQERPRSGAAGSVFEIKVTGKMGSNDAFFTGTISVVKDGRTESRSVEGRTPAQYSEEGAAVSAVFQNKNGYGHLQVEIQRGGISVASEETSASYGMVSVSSQ